MWRRSVLVPFLILAVAAILFVAIRSRWSTWGDNAAAQQTDDAYVRADQTPLSTRVSGTVRRVDLGDYQDVKAGQLIVELDDSDYQAVVPEAKAALEAAKAEYAANQNAKGVPEAGINAAGQGIEEAQAGAEGAQAGINSVQADVQQTQSEYQRRKVLLEGRAATRQQFEGAEDARSRASAGVQSRQADLTRASAVVASSRPQCQGQSSPATRMP
jgi:membrane fusion protein (multidrug efflux system)